MISHISSLVSATQAIFRFSRLHLLFATHVTHIMILDSIFVANYDTGEVYEVRSVEAYVVVVAVRYVDQETTVKRA